MHDALPIGTPGASWDRQARAVLRNPRERATYEAVVSLSTGSLLSWRHVEGVQPPMTAEEFMACEDVVGADERWQAAMRARGVEDFSLVMLEIGRASCRERV